MINKRFIDGLTLAFLVLIAFFWIGADIFIPTPDGTKLNPDLTIEKPVEAQLDLTLELIARRSALASGLVLSFLWVLSRPLQNEREVKERLVLCSLGLLFALFSLLAGYRAYENILTLLGSGVFDSFSSAISAPQQLQFAGLVGGAVLLGLAGIRASNAIFNGDQ